MCGIYLRIANTPCEEKLRCPVSYRGPDAFDRRDYSNSGQCITLAHWRLSILDPLPESNQPFSRTSNGQILIFNGEIYNYQELMQKIGGDFQTAGDTEVLLAAYEKWGVDCLQYLRGMFAFGIFDPVKRRVFLARDRFGIKPLYYRRGRGEWEFASEIKQLLSGKLVANSSRVKDFLLFGVQDHTDETLFQDILQLRGGECIEISLEHPESATVTQWYFPERALISGMSFDEASRAFRNKFFETIRLHLRSDVPLGFCLSGGMDSSAIVGVAGALLCDADHERIAINCRYRIEGLDEGVYAQASANLSHVSLLEVSPSSAHLAQALEKITYHMDEPVNNASVFSQYEVFCAAKLRGLKVMLDGQGGDELLASYPSFFWPYLFGLLKQFKFGECLRNASYFKKDHQWGFYDAVRSMALWFSPPWAYRLSKHLVSGRYQKKNIFKRDFLFGNGGFVPPWHSLGYSRTVASTQSLSLLMLQRISLPMLLHWEDRNSMANSIESRVPFLDHELVELALSFPDQFKIQDGVTKRVLKYALRDLVPPAISGRRDKMGFATPEQIWMKKDEDGFFKNLLDDVPAAFPEIFDQVGLSKIWREFQAGGRYNPILWRACMLLLWARVFRVDGK